MRGINGGCPVFPALFLFWTGGTPRADDADIMLKVVLHLTRGIIRDAKVRRSLMFYIMAVALVMVFAGTVLMSERWARDHVFLYTGYWLVCAWLTATGLLLALFDILIIRAANRAKKRLLEQELLDEARKAQDKK